MAGVVQELMHVGVVGAEHRGGALINTDVSEESHCNYWPEGEGPKVSGAVELPAWTIAVWQERSSVHR